MEGTTMPENLTRLRIFVALRAVCSIPHLDHFLTYFLPFSSFCLTFA